MTAPVEPLRAAVAERLRAAGQRTTPTRDALVAVLARAGRPVTIPEILAEDAELAQSSAYRNLVVLEQAGVVHRIVTNAEFARFELAEDLTGDHHHHLICEECGAVQDVPASPGIERALRGAIEQIERETGFRTTNHRIDLVGVCAECSAVDARAVGSAR
jgi:Fur family ferric uptake transcriptional regulator